MRLTKSDNARVIFYEEDTAGSSPWLKGDRVEVINIQIEINGTASVKIETCSNPDADNIHPSQKNFRLPVLDLYGDPFLIPDGEDEVEIDEVISQVGSTYTASGFYTVETSVPWYRVTIVSLEDVEEVPSTVTVLDTKTKS